MKTIVFAARSDGAGEPAETFAVRLGDSTGDTTLGVQRSAEVTIPASAGPVAPQSSVKRYCAGRQATVVGTAGRDVLRGTGRADVIAAFGGDDRVDGPRGNDLNLRRPRAGSPPGWPWPPPADRWPRARHLPRRPGPRPHQLRQDNQSKERR